jgi:hypothetical protein
MNFLCHVSRGGARQRKVTNGARTKRHVTAFAVRWQKNARQSFAFAVRRK